MKLFALDNETFVQKVMELYRDARRNQSAWRNEARELAAFRSGHQWSDDDRLTLDEQGRPPVVFNRAGTVIDAITGSEIANRQEVRYFPRTFDDSGKTEVATNIIRWVRDRCNAEDEETDAFEDCLIGGMGWVTTKVTYDDDPDGKIVIERVDPLTKYWDIHAKKHNLEDRQWDMTEMWIDKDDLHDMWPNAGEITPNDPAFLTADQDGEIHDASPPYYEHELTGFDKTSGQVRVLKFQWYEKETKFRVINPLNSKLELVSKENFATLEKRFPGIQSAPQATRKYCEAFVAGGTLLERRPIRINKFKDECITGKRDRKTCAFYGLMRGMKDPQEWANKFFSQILHIINSNSKGGFFYETGALANPNKAREDLSRPDGLVEVRPGKMNGIRERQMFQFPAGIDQMMAFAISSIRDVPGVNLELLGMTNRDQAGILETQRQKQALTVLAPIFSNLRRYRKNQGALLIEFAKQYIPEGTMIRIVGEDGAQYVKFMKDDMTFKYDLVVDQSPSSPNVKTEAWIALQAVLPILREAGFNPPKEIVDVLPLPESLVAKWKESIKNGLPPEVQQQIDELQQALQQASQENDSLKSKENIKMIEAQNKLDLSREKMEFDQNKFSANLIEQIREFNTETMIELKKLDNKISSKLIEASSKEGEYEVRREVAAIAAKNKRAPAERGRRK